MPKNSERTATGGGGENPVDLTELVDRTGEEIVFLKRQQEDLQKQKAELEILERKRATFVRDRRELIAELELAATVLDRESGELRKSYSLVESYRDVFRTLLDELQAIEEERWQAAEVKQNLDRALAALTRARIKYDEGRGKIAALSCGEEKRGIVIPAVPSRFEFPGPWELFWRGFFLFLPAALLAAAVILAAGKLR